MFFLEIFLNLLNIRPDALPSACIPKLPTICVSNSTNTQKLHLCSGRKKIFSFDISLEYATTTANFYAVILKHFCPSNKKILLRRFIKKVGCKSKRVSEEIVISNEYLEQHGFLLDILNEFMNQNFEILNPGTINISIYRSISYSMKVSETLIKETIRDFKGLLGISENLDVTDVVFQIAIQTSASDTGITKSFVYSNKFRLLFDENSVSVQQIAVS